MRALLDALRLRGHGDEHRRGQRLMLLTVAVFAWCMAYAVTQLVLGQQDAAATSIWMAGLTLSWPALLVGGRPRVAAHWACTCLAVFGAYRAVGESGTGTAGALLAVTPLVAALLFDRKEAVIWLGIAALALGLLGIDSAPLPEATDPHHLVDTAGAILVTWLLLGASERHAAMAGHELQDLQTELAAARERSDEAHSARERLLTEMNQEIRTPLNVVVGMSSLLLETQLDGTQKQYAQAIYRSGRSLGEVVDNVLDYDAVQRGDLALDVAPFGLRGLVADVLQAHAPAARARGLLLEGIVDARLPDILKGDGPRLRQVLMNLVGNALKFTEAGSVLVRAWPADERIGFAVEDTGPGIAEEAQARLFRAFEQADGSTTRRFGGTGLGLTISQSLVGLMGGQLVVRSKLGLGSTFSFELPLQSIHVPVPKRLGGRRVLVVDPRGPCREAIRAALERSGARVAEAGSASEAAQVLREAARRELGFDVALVASELGDLDAVTFAQVVAEDDLIADLPLVLVPELDDAAALPTSFRASVARPFRPSGLGDAVGQALHVQTTRRSLLDDTITGRRMDLPVLPGAVLVIEGEPLQQVLALQSLDGMVERVEVVGTSARALAEARELQPGLVLVDLHLEGVDELVLGLRRRLPDVPLVGLAASRSREVGERARRLGLVEVLTKPIRATTLRLLLERHLSAAA